MKAIAALVNVKLIENYKNQQRVFQQNLMRYRSTDAREGFNGTRCFSEGQVQ
jgi:hypothetical protein